MNILKNLFNKVSGYASDALSYAKDTAMSAASTAITKAKESVVASIVREFGSSFVAAGFNEVEKMIDEALSPSTLKINEKLDAAAAHTDDHLHHLGETASKQYDTLMGFIDGKLDEFAQDHTDALSQNGIRIVKKMLKKVEENKKGLFDVNFKTIKQCKSECDKIIKEIQPVLEKELSGFVKAVFSGLLKQLLNLFTTFLSELFKVDKSAIEHKEPQQADATKAADVATEEKAQAADEVEEVVYPAVAKPC